MFFTPRHFVSVEYRNVPVIGRVRIWVRFDRHSRVPSLSISPNRWLICTLNCLIISWPRWERGRNCLFIDYEVRRSHVRGGGVSARGRPARYSYSVRVLRYREFPHAKSQGPRRSTTIRNYHANQRAEYGYMRATLHASPMPARLA